MVNSFKPEGFTSNDQSRVVSYAKKMSQGLVAIRDSKKDGTSAHMQSSRAAKIDQMNAVVTQINKEIDEERRAMLARRKEESRTEYTANEAAAKFKFRDGGGGFEEKKKVTEEEVSVRRIAKVTQLKKRNRAISWSTCGG